MRVVIIDGSTVLDFINDQPSFKKNMQEMFSRLDLNHDGVLSRTELCKAFESLRLIESHFGVDVATAPEELNMLYDSIFEGFDFHKSGSVDEKEFEEEMRKILLSVSEGLGSAPIQMVLEDDDTNLLKQAADLEASKLAV